MFLNEISSEVKLRLVKASLKNLAPDVVVIADLPVNLNDPEGFLNGLKRLAEESEALGAEVYYIDHHPSSKNFTYPNNVKAFIESGLWMSAFLYKLYNGATPQDAVEFASSVSSPKDLLGSKVDKVALVLLSGNVADLDKSVYCKLDDLDEEVKKLVVRLADFGDYAIRTYQVAGWYKVAKIVEKGHIPEVELPVSRYAEEAKECLEYPEKRIAVIDGERCEPIKEAMNSGWFNKVIGYLIRNGVADYVLVKVKGIDPRTGVLQSSIQCFTSPCSEKPVKDIMEKAFGRMIGHPSFCIWPIERGSELNDEKLEEALKKAIETIKKSLT